MMEEGMAKIIFQCKPDGRRPISSGSGDDSGSSGIGCCSGGGGWNNY